jgi:hypothetical protein
MNDEPDRKKTKDFAIDDLQESNEYYDVVIKTQTTNCT